MARGQPGHPELPSDEELNLLSRLPTEAQARIGLECTKAEAQFHGDAVRYLRSDHREDYDPGAVENNKYNLLGMCDRLTQRVLRSYFDEMKALPIHPRTIRRLLCYIQVNITIQVFREKWGEYFPPTPGECEGEFLEAAIRRQKYLINSYYAEALQIHEKRVSEYLKTGEEFRWPEPKRESAKPKAEPVELDESEIEIFGRLSPEACLRIDADTAEMWAAYTPIIERARGLKAQILTLCEIVEHQYDSYARECLEVISSVEEFELALRRDIPKVIVWKLEHEPWLTDEMRKEMLCGMPMFVLDMPGWKMASPDELEKAWHVGAIFGESLRNLFLRWRAEALRRAASGGLPKPNGVCDIKPAGEETVPAQAQSATDRNRNKVDQVAAERRALLQAYKTEGSRHGVRITDQMVAEEACPTWHDRTPVQRWKRNDPRCTKADDAKIRAVLLKKPHLK
jgi:hypothetical protein